MTLLLVMEALESGAMSLDEEISISSTASSMGGSQVFLKEGERMSAEDLIKCTVIASANDAAVALAERVSGSVDAFVKRMNERAAELGMTNTNFDNPTGLDDTTDNNYTSAMDIAIMSRELLKYPIITKYSSMWQDSIRDGAFTLTNTNRLVRYYDGCNGLKTGSTDKAGYCISASAKRGDMQLIAVVMGASTRDERNQIARELLDLGFANYTVYKDPEQTIETVPVHGGKVDSLAVYSRPFSAMINKSDLPKVSKTYAIPDHITAPVDSSKPVGEIIYEIGGKMIGKCELFVKESVPRIGVFGLFVRILRSVTVEQSKNK
jgi:D-alanyl-D-alanine carboxypeptidase (penicillin-binding protein 5/6)